jgi:glyoxylase-like metal-dependent hydrolase (beta-lactamase superfamily II)
MALEPEVVEILSPVVRRITANNPSVFTGPGTNTYLIGRSNVTVIDPGPAMDVHVQAIADAPGTITKIIVTHTHLDHSPGTQLLQERLGVPAYGRVATSIQNQDTTFTPTAFLEDQQVIEGEDFRLKVIHTPGHASNHLCFLLEPQGMLFSGDHIMNGSTVVIRPPDGNMKAYIDSLKRLKQYRMTGIAPGHGAVLQNPYSVIDWIIKHRLVREKKILEKLRSIGQGTSDSLVEAVYDDVDSSLFPIAKWSLESHLIKLLGDGEISKRGNKYHS